MSDDELIGFAKRFIEEKGIRGRGELAKADEGLYTALRKRKLLDDVFVSLENENEKDRIIQVVSALHEFGDSH